MLVHHYVEEKKMDREKLFVVSVMPCVAKKFEARRPELSRNGHPDVDAVITTSELAKMIKAAGIVFNELSEESFDIPYGFSTGAAVIYGMTGGVAIVAGFQDHVDHRSQRIEHVQEDFE